MENKVYFFLINKLDLVTRPLQLESFLSINLVDFSSLFSTKLEIFLPSYE